MQGNILPKWLAASHSCYSLEHLYCFFLQVASPAAAQAAPPAAAQAAPPAQERCSSACEPELATSAAAQVAPPAAAQAAPPAQERCSSACEPELAPPAQERCSAACEPELATSDAAQVAPSAAAHAASPGPSVQQVGDMGLVSQRLKATRTAAVAQGAAPTHQVASHISCRSSPPAWTSQASASSR